MWIAGGGDTTTPGNLKYSFNGINWLNANNANLTSINSIGWNGVLWVCSGATGPAVPKLNYSYDGMTWFQGTNTFTGTTSEGGRQIAWTGRLWIAMGKGGNSSGSPSIKYSRDGISWTDATGFFTTPVGGFGYGVAFSSNLIPSYQQERLEIFSQNIPIFLRSTNQILAQYSSIVINNTLQVDGLANRVGINTNAPQYTLDVNGTSLISTLMLGPMTTAPSTSGFLLNLTRDLATKPTTNTWTTTSDQRIKDDIRDADYDRCYNDIKAVQLRRFTWADNFFQTVEGYDKRVLGFIAQEVSTIVPKAVRIGDGYGFSNFHYLNIDQLNMSLYGAVKKTISDKEVMESTIKGQRIQIETLQGTTTTILSTLEGLQGRQNS